ncbi:hypothetical protein FQN52_009432 [Onygenales sp. PD_12]|nr:hypothetical protein FQN52_009432 [Onygenales sp. PD_12]
MSVITEEAFSSGPVPATLEALFLESEGPEVTQGPPPAKRRRVNAAFSEDNAANLLSQYLTLARFELKITFLSPSPNGNTGLDNHRNFNIKAIPVEVQDVSDEDQSDSSTGRNHLPLATGNRKSFDLGAISGEVQDVSDEDQPDSSTGRNRLRLATGQSRRILDQVLEYRTFDYSRIVDRCLPSIYRSRKSAPIACSMSTLQKFKDDDVSFILETKILYANFVNIGKVHKYEPIRIFSKYVPRDPNHEPHSSSGRIRRLGHPSWTPGEFYESVHVPPKTCDLPSIAISGVVECQLFPFQRRAVRWLLGREGMDVLPDGRVQARPPSPTSTLPASFFEMKDADGRTCYASHLFRVLTSDLTNWNSAGRLRGGILAEEMGLGKTVEMITLISLNRRPPPREGLPVLRQWPQLTESGATLIITPLAILEQWQQEISAHAPNLRCIYYKGMKHAKVPNDNLVKQLASCDIVLTTYSVLQGEVHYAEDPPARAMRHARRVQPRKSPLVQISWWRVCIDEAQMIETGVSNAARVAQIIPRQNAWAVTGTPLRKDMNDLFGLLLFLHYEPLCYWLDVWKQLYLDFKPLFRSIIGEIVLRHNKEMIRDELHLPAQKRVVITVPFTAVEEQHYDQLFEQMCEECGLDSSGAPLSGYWNPTSGSTIERMRSWLTRLRQTCLHPEVSGTGRKTFGANAGPLRSVAEVLEVMIDQNDARIRLEERSLLLSQIRRGQLLENAGKPKEALKVWETSLELAQFNVEDSRIQLESERSKQDGIELDGDQHLTDDEEDNDDWKGQKNTRIGSYRHRLRNALEIEHICKFFIANAYYQIRTNTELTPPDSEDFVALENLEEETYEAAKRIRKEMLAQTNRRVSRFIKVLQAKVDQNSLVQIPEMLLQLDVSGMESRRLLDKLDTFCELMNKNTQQYLEWRQQMVKLLLESLIDEDDDAKLEGDEYESSTKHQDEMYVYMEALRVMFADYHDAITGQTNFLIMNEVKQGLEQARIGKGPSPELYMSMMKTRGTLKMPQELGSLRGIISELRSLATSLEWQEVRGSSRARTELAIVNNILQETSEMSSEHSRISSKVEKEVELFRDVMNQRLEYYRQFQQISDTVAPYEEESRGKPLDVDLFNSKIKFEENMEKKISTLKSKYRYLIHLRDESGAEESTRICIICQSSFEIGVLTVCGHKYCKDCLQFWWRQHRTCPMCKVHLKSSDFHQITYKPQELVAHEEKPTAHFGSYHSIQNSIYSDISSGVLKEIRNIDLEGSYGTKIDTLARHLIWLRQHDPGAKSIVFSQYKPFLGILASAFSHFKIGFSSIDSHDGIVKFKRDPSAECFLLHAKAHSSGLNLVNATHVFLCEPLINTAIELQAIARVHRIGQSRETTVWMYLVSDTVEESIYDISVSRRLAHIARKRKEEEKTHPERPSADERGEDESNMLETVIDAANSLELQDAHLANLMAGTAAEGERVPEDDLWQCLFAKTSRASRVDNENAEAMQNEVGRLLRAEAAEERIEEAANGQVSTN